MARDEQASRQTRLLGESARDRMESGLHGGTTLRPARELYTNPHPHLRCYGATVEYGGMRLGDGDMSTV